MKTIALIPILCLAFTSVPLAKTGDTSVHIHSVRPSWPIAREASGHWGVIGEAFARHGGRQPTEIRAVTFAVDGVGPDRHWRERTLLSETFETPEALEEIVAVFAHDASGGQTRRPAGTLTLQPDEVAVVYLAGLIDPQALPRRARVTMRFGDGAIRQFTPDRSFA